MPSFVFAVLFKPSLDVLSVYSHVTLNLVASPQCLNLTKIHWKYNDESNEKLKHRVIKRAWENPWKVNNNPTSLKYIAICNDGWNRSTYGAPQSNFAGFLQ